MDPLLVPQSRSWRRTDPAAVDYNLLLPLLHLLIMAVVTTMSLLLISAAAASSLPLCTPVSCPISLDDPQQTNQPSSVPNYTSTATVNVSFPFGTQPSCGASSTFLLSSDCQRQHELRWLGFANATATENSTVGKPDPFVMGIDIGQHVDSDCTDIGFTNSIDVAWNRTLAALALHHDNLNDGSHTSSNSSSDPDPYRHLICNPPSVQQIPEYLGSTSKISLHKVQTLRGNSSSALILDSDRTLLLLFNCTSDDIGDEAYASWEKNSSACRNYAADHGCGNKDTATQLSGVNSCLRLNSTPCREMRRTIHVSEWMEELNCSHFQMMMIQQQHDNGSSVSASPRLGMMRLLWNPYHPLCPACIGSRGECGYENHTTLENFVCFCPDGSTNITRCPFHNSTALAVRASDACGSGCRTALEACVPLAAACIAAVVIGVICITLRRRRRHRLMKSRSVLLSTPLASSNKLWTDRALALSSKFGPVSVKEFSYQELAEATGCFSDDNIIGDGGFGAVYLGFLQSSCMQQKVAVKMLYHDNFQRLDQFYNEIRILSTFQHPNLVKLHGFCCQDSRDLLLVFEYASNGTVWDQLHCDEEEEEDSRCRSALPSTKFPWEVRLRVACETADALSYMHNDLEPPIYHRDVKTSNILLDDDFHAKLADFGLSRLMPCGATHITTIPQGSPGYVDPDYHHCYRLTDKSDVYSFGVVLIELVSARPAVDMSRKKGEINLSTMAVAKIKTGAWMELVDPCLHMDRHAGMEDSVKAVLELAFTCLHAEKDDRPSMKQVAEALSDISSFRRRTRETNYDFDGDSEDHSFDTAEEGSDALPNGCLQNSESGKRRTQESTTPRSGTDSGLSTPPRTECSSACAYNTNNS